MQPPDDDPPPLDREPPRRPQLPLRGEDDADDGRPSVEQPSILAATDSEPCSPLAATTPVAQDLERVMDEVLQAVEEAAREVDEEEERALAESSEAREGGEARSSSKSQERLKLALTIPSLQPRGQKSPSGSGSESSGSELWGDDDEAEERDLSLRRLADGRPAGDEGSAEDQTRRCSWMAFTRPDASLGLVRVAIDDLQEAALRGDLKLAERLVASGASVNAPIRPENEAEFMCLLHVLASKPELPRCSEIMAEVIRWGANLNVRSSTGSTPLSRACITKHLAAVKVLLEHGADPYAIDDAGRRAPACAVVLRRGWPADEEAASCIEIVRLMAEHDVDLDQGGDVSPIVLAVRAQRHDVVTALLEGNATADGLHEAVEHGDLPLIAELTQHFANPFNKDHQGRTVMDIALFRGDDDVTTLLRDYIGDLQRMQHSHMKVFQEQLKREAEEDALALLNATGTIRRTLVARASQIERRGSSTLRCMPRWLEAWLARKGIQRHLDRLGQICRRINKNRFFQSAMFACLLFALFLPDMWVLANVESNDALDVLLIIILIMFFLEFLVQVIGLWRSYVCTFFFWMDLVGVLSVPLDHSLVVNSLPQSLDNAVVMRAARMAKLGARAGRFTKLVKLLRFLPGMKDVGNDGTAKVISGFLNRALSMRVSCLIIVMVMVLPMFELVTFPENDFSLKMWTEEVGDLALIAFNETPALLQIMDAFYAPKHYYPFRVVIQPPGGGRSNVTMLPRLPPRRLQNRMTLKSAAGNAEVVFNFQVPNQIDALCNVLLIIIIMIMMVGSALVLSSSVSGIVMKPLEQLFDNVQRVASKIFNSVTNLTGKEEEEEYEESDDEETADPMGAETKLLEKVLQKIAVLSEITMKASPLDAEQMQQLDERDRAMLAGYGGVASTQDSATATLSKSHLSVTQLERLAFQSLADAGVSKEALESWDFNVTDLGEGARHALCLSMMLMSYGATGDNFGKRADAFVVGARACYNHQYKKADKTKDNNDKPGLFHNWVHAVDVTFSLTHLQRVCGTDHFLGANERFALVVAAICHDMGHWGFNNSYLIETNSELAVRYNDQSPLENMSCARLFELTRQDDMAIFGDLEDLSYREVRHVIIEAILKTDFRHHNSMVKEIQNLYDMNVDLFSMAEEQYSEEMCAFPAKEVADFMRGAEVKKQLRMVLVHMADISSPMKPWALAELWANLLIEEMLHQGDVEKERGLPVGPLNDRDRINRPYSQIGFIEFFVSPLLLALSVMMPPLEALAVEPLLENLDQWFKRWVEESMPPEEEVRRVADRIVLVTTQSLGLRGKQEGARGST